ncbi:MAG: YqgE/AlgH family protein [Dokdonella sp.]
MSANPGLSSQLLIAMPSMRDANFARSVTFVCQHGEDGAMGLQINKLSEYRLGDVLDQMLLTSDLQEVIDAPVLIGGPVQPERGFVLHTPSGGWDSSFRITEKLSVTTSRDILVAMAEGRGPDHALVALGYSGWSPGQIEQELKENTWLTAPATQQILFSTPLESRWQASAALLGVTDLVQLTSYAGHA